MTTTYTLDMNTRLTQVLTDGTDSYLYGYSRLGEYDGTDWVYYHGDALGSVRQLTDSAGAVTLMQSYDPYGNVTDTIGFDNSNYGYTGQFTDETGLQHLRARYYAPGTGRFTSRDTWGGDYNRPLSLNKWAYTEGNPVNYADPSGYAKNALERLFEIIDEKGNGAAALFGVFEDNELGTTWKDEAGTTLKTCLEWLLKVTSNPVIPSNFQINFGLDDCFAEEFRDSQFYKSEVWNLDLDSNNQVAHFLTAVRLIYKNTPAGINAIIGHEKIGDTPHNGGWQALQTTKIDAANWTKALQYDRQGRYSERDKMLWKILGFEEDIPFGYVVDKEGVEDNHRVGNSLQDLRLSLKGHRFANYVKQNPALHPGYGAYWLRINLWKHRSSMSPFGP